MQLEFTWDEAGDPRAEGATEGDLLARYLETDIGTSRHQGLEILEAIDHVVESSGSWADTGNAHTLRLTREGATIASSFDESAPLRHLPLADLRQTVAAWLSFLERGREG